MTRSEKIQLAINVSNMDCRQCATKSECRDCPVDTVRSILLAEQKRGEGCDYCKHHGNPSAVVWDAHKIKEAGNDAPNKPFMSVSMYTRKGEGELRVLSQSADNKQNQIIIPARFCLNCGRDLTEGESV